MIDRINEIISYTGLSERSFAEKINIKQNTLNQQLNGERGVSLDTTLKILNSFENISAEWLLRGKGEMFKGENTTTESGNAVKEFVVYADENGFLRLKQ